MRLIRSGADSRAGGGTGGGADGKAGSKAGSSGDSSRAGNGAGIGATASTAARKALALLSAVLLCAALSAGCSAQQNAPTYGTEASSASASQPAIAPGEVPDYSGEPYVELNGGVPDFSEEDAAAPDGAEVYGELDHLGRATLAFAKVCETTMPPAGSKRDNDMPDPTGFAQASYPSLDLDHLYDRTHLIARSLTNEDVNPKDLMTGTQALNKNTMALFENRVRGYLDSCEGRIEHGGHVLMRVTPDFREDELVARGVQMEALSLDDGGKAVSFNVYCYNVQPGVEIDYATGKSWLAEEGAGDAGGNGGAGDATGGAGGSSGVTANGGNAAGSSTAADSTAATEEQYVLNTRQKTMHRPGCSSIDSMSPKNRQDVTALRDDLVAQGYSPCKRCKP